MAIDHEGGAEAQAEFLDKGLLLEFVAEGRAKELWDSATWPCPHHLRVTERPEQTGTGGGEVPRGEPRLTLLEKAPEEDSP